MCTVTIVSTGPGRVRLAANRDEQRTRPPAPPPVERTAADPSGFGRRAVMPVDPASGGTWIAVTDAGLALTVLNVNLPGYAPAGPVASRGMIVPLLAGFASLPDAAAVAAGIDPRAYPPFRLVLCDARGWAEVRSDGRSLASRWADHSDGPAMFTSSGLGDHLVEGPRRELFEEMFRGAGRSADDLPARQDAFHRHAWADRRHLSVCMSRADARTVSHTIIETDAEARTATLTYFPDAPDAPETAAEPTSRSLRLR
jgi:hypothetical protein